MARDCGEDEMPLKQASELLAEAHEDRIQQLERTQEDHSVEIATIRAEINTGFEGIGEQIRTAVEPAVRNLSGRLEKLEDKEQKRKDRISMLKKGLWAVILTVFGGLVKHAIDHWK